MATKLRNERGKNVGRFLKFMDDHSDDTIEFEKYKNQSRGISLEIRSRKIILTGGTESMRCDLGHQHLVPIKNKRESAYLYLDDADIQNLRDFLNDDKWFPKRKNARKLL